MEAERQSKLQCISQQQLALPVEAHLHHLDRRGQLHTTNRMENSREDTWDISRIAVLHQQQAANSCKTPATHSFCSNGMNMPALPYLDHIQPCWLDVSYSMTVPQQHNSEPRSIAATRSTNSHVF
jgi:hypothetical protein